MFKFPNIIGGDIAIGVSSNQNLGGRVPRVSLGSTPMTASIVNAFNRMNIQVKVYTHHNLNVVCCLPDFHINTKPVIVIIHQSIPLYCRIRFNCNMKSNTAVRYCKTSFAVDDKTSQFLRIYGETGIYGENTSPLR